MNTTRRCSSCKLYRKIELFQKPLSNALFNTCENCRIKKRNNYHRQKSRHLKDLTTEDDHLSPVTTSYNDLSMIQKGISIVTPRSNVLGVFASIKTTDDKMSFLPILTFPRSTWVRSSVPVALRDVFVARALFHYTLCNPHRSL